MDAMPLHGNEAAAFVHTKGAIEVVRVHAQTGLGHAGIALGPQTAQVQGPAKPRLRQDSPTLMNSVQPRCTPLARFHVAST
ncbi:hypothetical protein SAMN05880557_1029 [Pseudacidovorax sp. RU35E]|nr:hypothetical protein SAMN05880557_1029 [Pseudacidovorax sp. RU35E]